jgi:hypothetical protein
VLTASRAGPDRRVVRAGEAASRHVRVLSSESAVGLTTLAERDAKAAVEAMQQAQAAAAAAREAELTKTMEQTELDITYAGLTTTTSNLSSKSGVKKKPGKPKLTAKEKKERSVRPAPTFASVKPTPP